LRQLGWVEGNTLGAEWRFGEGHAEHLPQMAADLVRLPVEVLLAVGASAAGPAHQQTTTIPTVLVTVGDPTVSELVQLLARPVGNVTGATIGSSTMSIKSVELLRTVLPQLSRLAILGDPMLPAYASIVLPAAHAAQTQGLQVKELDLETIDEVDATIETARAWGG
jgi:putative ABC transport system substrate-binding protein